ncbi:MAG: hypothetical protein AAFU60_12280 [Bacteroidota bacterium]
MPLRSYCQGCRKEMPIRSYASTQVDLEQEKGLKFMVNCPECGKNNQVHVNQVFAKPNNWIILAGVALGAFLTAGLMYFFGYIAMVTFVIPILIVNQQRQTAHAFNVHRL